MPWRSPSIAAIRKKNPRRVRKPESVLDFFGSFRKHSSDDAKISIASVYAPNPFFRIMEDTPDSLSREASPEETRILRSYWRKNIILMLCLLAVLASVSFGCGILWADSLNAFRLPGTHYPLGFWFAQQGSILTFVILILIYALTMNRLDRRHLKDRESLEGETPMKGEGE